MPADWPCRRLVAGRLIPERLLHLVRAGLRRHGRRPLLREEARHELRAVRRQLEERLVHQLRVQVAATDVVMNTIFGFIAAMYVKFCSGPTPRYTPRLRAVQQICQDVLKPDLVREQVVRPELTARLRQFFAEFQNS